MKVRLVIEKDNALLFERAYDICDAEIFGSVCSHAWAQMRERRLARTTSIGALFEELDNHSQESVLDELGKSLQRIHTHCKKQL